MHRIINLNAAVNRPAHGAFCRSRQRDHIYIAYRSPLRTWMTSNGCLLTSLAHTAPTRSSRAREFPSFSAPSALSRSGANPSMGQGVVWTSRLGLNMPFCELAVHPRRTLQPRVVRSFHASSRNHGHPALLFLVPLLKTSTSLAVIKTGTVHIT